MQNNKRSNWELDILPLSNNSDNCHTEGTAAVAKTQMNEILENTKFSLALCKTVYSREASFMPVQSPCPTQNSYIYIKHGILQSL